MALKIGRIHRMGLRYVSSRMRITTVSVAYSRVPSMPSKDSAESAAWPRYPVT
jgi:hypothetical protein